MPGGIHRGVHQDEESFVSWGAPSTFDSPSPGDQPAPRVLCGSWRRPRNISQYRNLSRRFSHGPAWFWLRRLDRRIRLRRTACRTRGRLWPSAAYGQPADARDVQRNRPPAPVHGQGAVRLLSRCCLHPLHRRRRRPCSPGRQQWGSFKSSVCLSRHRRAGLERRFSVAHPPRRPLSGHHEPDRQCPRHQRDGEQQQHRHIDRRPV
jgi:hypothetical protein